MLMFNILLSANAEKPPVYTILFAGNNFQRLLWGLFVTLRVSLIAVLLSLPLGILFGLFMRRKDPISRGISQLYLAFIRIMPPLVLLFLVYFGTARIADFHLSGEASGILVFTLWGTAEMGDLVRAAIGSIPRHQKESGRSLGLSSWQIYRYIIIPQTVRRLIPLSINLITRMIKTTSLIVLIGVVEVLKTGQQIIDANRFQYPKASIVIYAVIFFLYFIVCFPISQLGKYLEKKLKV